MAPGEQVPAVPPPPSGETTSTDAAQDQTPPNALVEFAREAWTQALVAVNATEEEVQRIVSRVSGWVEMGPEEARRLRAELSDKLRSERDQLEAGIESAVKKALMPFRVPSMEDLAALHARVSVLEARVDRLITRRQSA
jgi:polyhydroxyalkanoate synthesis regulator phasin